MILSNNFVFIHQPKTGGTFVFEMLKQLYSSRGNPYLRFLPVKIRAKIRKDFIIRHDLKHSMCHHIPASHQGKPIIASVRSPYTRYVSEYEFGWWKKHPHWDKNNIKELYPSFPDLSFDEFYELLNTLFLPYHLNKLGLGNVINLGYQSWLFIEYFFRDPAKVISEYCKDPKNYQINKTDMFDIRFIKTENLNYDLFHSLIKLDYPKDDLLFILQAQKILPDDEGRRREKEDIGKYYSSEMKQKVRVQEQFIFKLFPEYDEY